METNLDKEQLEHTNKVQRYYDLGCIESRLQSAYRRVQDARESATTDSERERLGKLEKLLKQEKELFEKKGKVLIDKLKEEENE